MYASREGRTAVVKLLLEAGADVDAKNEVRHSHEIASDFLCFYHFRLSFSWRPSLSAPCLAHLDDRTATAPSFARRSTVMMRS